MENFSSAPALMYPSILIFPETLKHLSSALGLPSFAQGLAQPRGRWAGSQAETKFIVRYNGDGGLPAQGCPRQLERLLMNKFYCYFQKKDPHFHCSTEFAKFPHLPERQTSKKNHIQMCNKNQWYAFSSILHVRLLLMYAFVA